MRTIEMQTRRVGTMKVAVVDPRPADYSALLEATLESGVRLEFLPSGQDALRLARTGGADLWVINADLPDMSGIDLCAMLRSHSSRQVVFVVTDTYRAEVERAARGGGASLFACKPVQTQWFDTWARRR